MTLKTIKMRTIKNLKFIISYDMDKCFESHAREINHLNNEVHQLKQNLYQLLRQVKELTKIIQELKNE